MKPRFPLALAVVLILFSGWACAQATPKAALLALSKKDHTLCIIDPANLNIVARIPVGDDHAAYRLNL